MTDSGREVADAISSILKVDVLLAENCACFANAIQFPEHFPLQGHALENGFDHEVGSGEIAVAQRWRDALQSLFGHFL